MDIADRLDRIEERLAQLEALVARRGAFPRAAHAAPASSDSGASLAEAPPAPRRPEPLPAAAAAAAPSPAVVPPTARPPAEPAAVAGPPAGAVAEPIAPVPPPRAPGGRRGGPERVDRSASGAPRATPPRDLERFVGVSVLGRVGVAALLLAAAYFGQWTWARIPPLARVGALYGLAGVLVGAGALVRARVARVYLALLWGGGVAAAYLAGAVAKLRFDLVGPTTSVALLAGACVLGQALARVARVQTLALVAIAGAAAAPVLVGGAQDARTPLLVYLLVVHGWSAWVEARWGWAGARWVGLVATVATAGAWLRAHGGADASTHLHVQLYLLGWTAPEWAARAFARPLSASLASFVALAVGVVEGAAVWTSAVTRGDVERWLPAVAGATWLSVALTRRLRLGAPDALVRGLARVGGVLLALGAATAVGPDTALAFGPERTSVLALAAAGGLALALRRYLGVGEGATSVAVALGLLGVLAVRAAGFDAATLPALALAGALALRGDRASWRVVGFVAAAVWPFAAWGHGAGAGPAALLASHATSALVVLGALHPRVRGDDPSFARAALVLLLALGALWGALALGGRFDAARPSPLDAGSLAALAGVAATVFARRRGARSFAAGRPADVLDVAAVAWLLGATWRVVHAAAGSLAAADVGVAVETATLASAGWIATGIGVRWGPRAAPWAGLGIVALAAAHAFATIATPGAPWSAAAQVVAVALPAAAIASTGGERGRRARAAGVAALGASAVLWATAVAVGRFGPVAALEPARLLSGALVAVGFALARRAAGQGDVASFAAVASVVVGYAVGLVEVLDVVAPVASDPWRRGLVSLYSMAACAATLSVGFRLRDPLLRWLSLVGFGLVVGKVGLFDLAAVPTPVRVAVTGALGAVLLVAAYAYARGGRGDAGGDGGPPPPDAAG